jgi:hypothetical protein
MSLFELNGDDCRARSEHLRQRFPPVRLPVGRPHQWAQRSRRGSSEGSTSTASSTAQAA